MGTLAVLAGLAVTVFGAFWVLDFFSLPATARRGMGPLDRLLSFDPETLRNALGNLAQVIAAVLGIAITVVSIIVQLAATRYTPRVAEMFFRDRTNLAAMGFFVIACIDTVWVSLSVSDGFVPTSTVLSSVVFVTISLLMLMPYFAYVFDFLDPEKVIARIGEQTLDNALGRTRRARRATDLDGRQASTVTSMEQLADIAVNALAQKDKVIASNAIASLRRVVVEYLRCKSTLPGAWFRVGSVLRENPDFVALASDSLSGIVESRSWVEWKGLRQLGGVFNEALKTMPDTAHVVAIETRYVGEAALATRDPAVLVLAIKFMNTYLRASLNGRDVRTAYNVLNQYRLLAESVLRSGDTNAALRLPEIAGYFKYYAQLAHGMGLGFVTETAAYDLCTLCELASVSDAPVHDQLLATFLEIDKEAETTAEERALRGVRKAQAKLAAYYLSCEMTSRARQIHADMAAESVDRLRSIRDEMLAVTTKEFWEVVERGKNFDYLDDNRKTNLRDFFDWFPALRAGADPPAVAIHPPKPAQPKLG